MWTECPFCHKRVFVFLLWLHIRTHARQRPDGQQSEYITLKPKDRETGSLEGVPQVYRHDRCGKLTRMPEKIIRSYLKNPFIYGSGTFCTGCRKHVSEKECVWVETGENMADYMIRLKEEARARGVRRPIWWWFLQ